ncbi:MAG: hypothetical protein ACFFA7_06620 [Promethearchaeota archaeon]
MKNEKLEIKREEWEYLRQYRQAPFQKRYLEMLNEKELMSTPESHN